MDTPLPTPPTERPPSLQDVLRYAQHELHLHLQTYPQLVKREVLEAWQANHRLACQEALITLVKEEIARNQGQMALWQYPVRADAGGVRESEGESASARAAGPSSSSEERGLGDAETEKEPGGAS